MVYPYPPRPAAMTGEADRVPPDVKQRCLAVWAAAAVLLSGSTGGAQAAAPADRLRTFSQYAGDAVATVLRVWYAGGSAFVACPGCGPGVSSDWGTDSLVEVLYERWQLAHDPLVAAAFANIVTGEPANTLGGFSDVPMWDAVAALRAYDVTGDPRALANARQQYRRLVSSAHFALGPCRPLDGQVHDRGGGGLVTLETDANRILAAVLLARRTGDTAEARADLADAQTIYAAVRATFLDPRLPLYTVYAFGAGGACAQVPRQFFASVNGRMIEAGLALAAATHRQHFADEARATGDAIALLADDRGIFADLQAQNDIVTPLVLAMLALSRGGDAAATDWILRNAGAAAHARAPDGSYARFFDGPPPPSGAKVSVFETSGAFALMVAAGALAPDRQPEPDAWPQAVSHAVAIAAAPAVYAFTGSGIALIGALPKPGSPDCHKLTVGPCEGGHVRLRIDRHEMVDRIGIWQGKALVDSPATVLFAWRWPAAGPHELELDPAAYNPKQGGTEIDVTQVLVLP